MATKTTDNSSFKKAAEKIAIKHKGEHRYLTHDNGGRPFLVYAGKTKVTVYKVPKKIEQDPETDWLAITKDDYTEFVKEFTGIKKIFLPRTTTSNTKGTKKETVVGSSILVQTNTAYIFIGHKIYSFKPEDTIKKFFSPIGNSDSPYPLAVGDTNVYFCLEQEYVDKNEFGKKTDWAKDGYGDFYDLQLDPKRKKVIQKMKGVKEIVKRPW